LKHLESPFIDELAWKKPKCLETEKEDAHVVTEEEDAHVVTEDAYVVTEKEDAHVVTEKEDAHVFYGTFICCLAATDTDIGCL
jgi:CO dehydrogenase/acetyl-CoA synthase beta subunit